MTILYITDCSDITIFIYIYSIYICMYVCMYVCICMYVYVYMGLVLSDHCVLVTSLYISDCCEVTDNDKTKSGTVVTSISL